jgi:hypothetical protein
MEVRSLSRLRGRAGVFPQNAPVEGIDFPPPAALFERVDLPRKRERCSEPADRLLQPKFIKRRSFFGDALTDQYSAAGSAYPL